MLLTWTGRVISIKSGRDDFAVADRIVSAPITLVIRRCRMQVSPVDGTFDHGRLAVLLTAARGRLAVSHSAYRS